MPVLKQCSITHDPLEALHVGCVSQFSLKSSLDGLYGEVAIVMPGVVAVFHLAVWRSPVSTCLIVSSLFHS
jgi:hypothetical protein